VDSNGKYPDEVVLKFPDAINFLSIYALIMISTGAFLLKNKKKIVSSNSSEYISQID
jgi:hypothetical protein